jgi:hypothetical protein
MSEEVLNPEQFRPVRPAGYTAENAPTYQIHQLPLANRAWKAKRAAGEDPGPYPVLHSPKKHRPAR